MSDWSAAGLPGARRSNYGYSIDAGPIRTSFDTPRPRQRRRQRQNLRTFSLSFVMTPEQLSAAYAFIAARGYDWFSIDLVSGEGSVAHTVRLLDVPSVNATKQNEFAMTIKVEEFPTPVSDRNSQVYDALPGPGYWRSDKCAGYVYVPPEPTFPTLYGLFVCRDWVIEVDPSVSIPGTLMAQEGDWRIYKMSTYDQEIYYERSVCTTGGVATLCSNTEGKHIVGEHGAYVKATSNDTLNAWYVGDTLYENEGSVVDFAAADISLDGSKVIERWNGLYLGDGYYTWNGSAFSRIAVSRYGASPLVGLKLRSSTPTFATFTVTGGTSHSVSNLCVDGALVDSATTNFYESTWTYDFYHDVKMGEWMLGLSVNAGSVYSAILGTLDASKQPLMYSGNDTYTLSPFTAFGHTCVNDRSPCGYSIGSKTVYCHTIDIFSPWTADNIMILRLFARPAEGGYDKENDKFIGYNAETKDFTDLTDIFHSSGLFDEYMSGSGVGFIAARAYAVTPT